ncbi:vacuolar-processing enzyme-like [Vicia villosa]|uniref:vacuolar-processing enzyme-like n=1 Tax=Vicia villosa TaxID=3911 RepID=UPI00273C8049|nr:vacuolar-processing enzyme-like [Vicia villosa]
METTRYPHTYLSLCVATALIVMSVMLVLSNVVKHQNFEEKWVSVSQDDATLLYLKLKWENAPAGSEKKLKAQKELEDEIADRKHADNSVYRILNHLFGKETSSTMLTSTPLPGAETSCLKMMIKTYEQGCGVLSDYGMKYTMVFANMCNAGISEKQMTDAASQACPAKKK